MAKTRYEGVIRLPNSPYLWIHFTHPLTKKRVRMSSKTTNEAKAAELRDKLKNASWDEEQLNKVKCEWTVRELIDWCWDEFWSQKDNPPEKEVLYLNLKKMLERIGDTTARLIDKKFLRDYRKKRETGEEAVSRQTTNRELTYLNFAFNRAVEEGKLSNNPAAKMRGNENSFKRDVVGTEEIENAFIENSTGMFNKILQFAFATGMDEGEIRKLKPENVDFYLQVVKTERWKGDELIRRVIPFDVSSKYDIAQILISVEIGKYPYVFHNGAGKMIPKDGLIHSAFQRLRKKLVDAGIDLGSKGFRFKDIRHRFATKLYLRTGDVVKVSKLLGHRKLDTTMTYLNLTVADLSSGLRQDFDIQVAKPSEEHAKITDNQQTGL